MTTFFPPNFYCLQKTFFVCRFSKILVQMYLNLLLKVIMLVFLHMDRQDLGSPTP